MMSLWPVGCFEGKQFLVVGGTSGIGEAIARAFQSEGAEVAGAAQRRPGARLLALDVCDAGAVRREVAALSALDHVVYAAGIIRRGEEHEPDVFDRVVDVNLHG